MIQCGGQGLCAERRRRLPEFFIEFVGIHIEEPADVPHGELAAIDAGISAQDGRQKQTRAAIKLVVQGRGRLGQEQALRLGEGSSRIRGGQGVEEHDDSVAQPVKRSEGKKAHPVQDVDETSASGVQKPRVDQSADGNSPPEAPVQIA